MIPVRSGVLGLATPRATKPTDDKPNALTNLSVFANPVGNRAQWFTLPETTTLSSERSAKRQRDASLF